MLSFLHVHRFLHVFLAGCAILTHSTGRRAVSKDESFAIPFCRLATACCRMDSQRGVAQSADLAIMLRAPDGTTARPRFC